MTDTTLLSTDGETQGENTTTAQVDGVQAESESQVLQNESQNLQAESVEREAPPAEYKFEMPEGVELDSGAAGEFGIIAKELGLSQAQADKVAQVGANMALRQQEAHAEQIKTWIEDVKGDPEIGGANLDANMATARKAIDTFGSPELKALLNQSGLGNHPEMVKLAFKIGKAISDDKLVVGGQAANTREMADIMYPSMQPKS